LRLASIQGAFQPRISGADFQRAVNHCRNPVCGFGLKPVIARVRPDVRPPSIRWRQASLILHAHYAGVFSGNMPHL
jgi:hypothetical protein